MNFKTETAKNYANLRSLKGFGGLLVILLSVLIGIILIMVVVVPVTKTAITSANLSGTDLTVANTIPTFLVIGGLVLAAGVSLYAMVAGARK
jgi:hypothetical protein